MDSDPLLTSSRTALISVTEVEFQKLWSDLYVAISSGGRITVVDVSQWAAYVKLFGVRFKKYSCKVLHYTFCSVPPADALCSGIHHWLSYAVDT